MAQKILVVDDEEHIRMVVEARLGSGGYQIALAADGETALEEVKKDLPDLILLDINMPGMNGFKVLQHLRRDRATARIPVIMLTAQGDTDSILKAQDFKVTDYLIKPFEGDELLSMVGRYI